MIFKNFFFINLYKILQKKKIERINKIGFIINTANSKEEKNINQIKNNTKLIKNIKKSFCKKYLILGKNFIFLK